MIDSWNPAVLNEGVQTGQIGKGGSDLPEVTSDDNGNVLTVVSGEWNKAAIPSQLPSVDDSDEGKVLMVNSSGNWAKGDIPTPTIDLSDPNVTYTVVTKSTGAADAAVTVSDGTTSADITALNPENNPFVGLRFDYRATAGQFDIYSGIVTKYNNRIYRPGEKIVSFNYNNEVNYTMLCTC